MAKADPPAKAGELGSLSRALERLSKRVGPSVVKIGTVGGFDVSRASATGQLPESQRAIGSGVIVDPSGYIVTNHHVVAGAKRVNVVLGVRDSQSRSILKRRVLKPAQVVGSDRETDLAVLKIEGQGFPHLAFSDSDEVQQGQVVLAFGSPLGLRNSVSLGVISAQARQLEAEHPVVFIQSDVAINPGNSGGPLVNVEGGIVGINSTILSRSGGSDGLSFAIPSNIVEHVYNQIREHGRVRRGLIGVNAQTIDHYIAAGLGLPSQSGVILADVDPDGPASMVGLEVGDIVLSMDGKRMENGRQFDVNVYRKSTGDRIQLEILRNGKKRRFTIVASERPDTLERITETVGRSAVQISSLGIVAVDLSTYGDLSSLPLRIRSGVVIVGVGRQTPSIGLPPARGDVIHRVNGTEIHSLSGLRTVLSDLKGPAVLQVERGGRLHLLTFDL